MAAAVEVQALLRFLTQDAKLPLSACLPKVGELRKAQLGTPEGLASSDLKAISAIFTDEKLAKQVFNAAKRVTNPKKRSASTAAMSPASKLMKVADGSAQSSEAALEIPHSDLTEDVLSNVVLQTNRAPLVLAFAVTLLKYTMSEQPVSSRLSLAQAVVSANSQSKAKSIGITTGPSAAEDGWAQGQPKVKVMGREIAVMRRATTQADPVARDDSQPTLKSEECQQNREMFWGLDLDALRKSNGPLVAGKNSGSGAGLPIYHPESARNYLIRSMTVVEDKDSSVDDVKAEPSTDNRKGFKAESLNASTPKKKPTAKELSAKKEEAVAALLQTLDLLFSSWAHLSRDELDRRAWSWYLHVRPDIAQGQAGWGQKGEVRLADILKLRKDAGS